MRRYDRASGWSLFIQWIVNWVQLGKSLPGRSLPGRSLPGVLLIGVLWLSSCDQHRVFEENVDFQDKQWLVDTVPAFQFEIKDPSQPYNIYWNVRNTIEYPYRNLYITYYLEDTSGHHIASDLHDMLLFEPKTGRPYGSGLGDIFSHQLLALPDYHFDSAGVYRIRLQQYMRTDTLPDIVSVGVRVEEDVSN